MAFTIEDWKRLPPETIRIPELTEEEKIKYLDNLDWALKFMKDYERKHA